MIKILLTTECQFSSAKQSTQFKIVTRNRCYNIYTDRRQTRNELQSIDS